MTIDWKMDWEEICNKKINEMRGSLRRTYEEGSKTYKFSVNRIEPFMYGTIPRTGDFNMFVDIELDDKGSKNTSQYKDVSLGSVLNETPRKLIPLGERFFNENKQTLCHILISAWEEHLKQYEKK